MNSISFKILLNEFKKSGLLNASTHLLAITSPSPSILLKSSNVKFLTRSISLLNFYVDISYNHAEDDFILRVSDYNMNKYYYLFDNYEDTIDFSYDVIDKAFTINEIDIAYWNLKEVKKHIK